MMVGMPSDRARIASLVRGELAIAGVSGRKLAERMGWPVDGTLRRLRGDVAFRGDELMAIARELGVSPAKFLAEPHATQAAS
jgi:hypothetical protein